MTRIYYREYYDRSILSVEGHSGYGEKGEDIVCAALSAIVYTLINCMLDEESADRVKIIRKIINDGSVYLEIEYFDFCRERTRAIFETCLSGLYMIEENYPRYVRFE